MRNLMVMETILGAILVVVGIITSAGTSPGLSYDAGNIVGAILVCFGLLFIVDGAKGLLSK